MNFKLEEGRMTLYFQGELNSTNAQDVEAEIEKTLKGQDFSELVLDFSNLIYVSSAGLRIVLKLKKQYSDVSIINVSLEVYDILEMTGFVNILNVKKSIKEISVDGCKVIGEGFFSTVYRLDKDTIIKVFNRVSDVGQIDRELNLAKQAFILGVPTAISYDIVKVKDKLGVRFEMLDCKSLRDCFRDYPEQYDALIEKYVELLKKINTTECYDDEVPDIKQFFLQKVEFIKEFLEEKDYQKCKKLIESIPDSDNFVHGDCHFKNIMVQDDEFLLIDMDTLSRGHYIFELAAIRAPYVAFEEDDPGNSEKFLGMSGEKVSKLYNDVVDHYIKNATQEVKDKIALVCYIHMVWWNRVNEPNNQVRFNGCKGRLLELLHKYNDLDLGE